MLDSAGGTGLSRPTVIWVSLQSTLRNSRFAIGNTSPAHCGVATSHSVAAVALAEVIPGQRTGARRVGGVARRLAIVKRFHGRLVKAHGVIIDCGFGFNLNCGWLNFEFGIDLGFDLNFGETVCAAKVDERSAPFTGRPPTQPSRSVAVCVSDCGPRSLLAD